MRYSFSIILLLCFGNAVVAQTKKFEDNKFIYKLITGFEVDIESKDTSCFVKQIVVINKTTHKVLQKIIVPDNRIYCNSSNIDFIVEDMNFDNRNDFRLEAARGGHNVSYYCWIYKPNLQKFIRDSTLEEITSPDFDTKNKLITSSWSGSYTHTGSDTYKYIKGKITLVEEDEWYRDNEYFNKHISTTRKLINGKMVLVDSTVDVDMSIVPEESTLDSLQGFWISTDDILNKMLVKGRVYTSIYDDEDSLKQRDRFSIFFSDTLLKMESLNEHSYDSSKTSGKYLVLATNKSETEFWCYRIEAFFEEDKIKGVSIVDTWAKRRPTNFRKVK
jgi:hypothetical protein